MTLGQEEREAAVELTRYAGLFLPERPRLAPWLVPVDLGDGRLQLRSAESLYTLTNPLLIQVFRQIEKTLDGRRTVDEIVSTAGLDVLPTTTVFLLKLLQGRGLMQHGSSETIGDPAEHQRWRRQVRFLAHFLPDPQSAHRTLTKARVGLAGSADLLQAIVSAMKSMGLEDVNELDPATWGTEARGRPDKLTDFDVIIACAESPAFSFFNSVNSACLASGTRWLRVLMSATSAQLGPTIVPHQTACHTCLDLRSRAHQRDLDGYLAYRAHLESVGPTDEGSIAPFRSAVAGQVALEITRLLVGFAPPVTPGRFYELSVASPVAIAHDVLRVPGCPSCGRPNGGTSVGSGFYRNGR